MRIRAELHARAAAVLLASTLVFAGALGRPALAQSDVTVDCASQSLQGALDAAAVGATVLVSGTCHGNFVVNNSVTITGNPTATLDGDETGPTVEIKDTNSPDVVLQHLVVTGGFDCQSAGIQAADLGSVTLRHVVVTNNIATGECVGPGHYARGAGVGVLEATLAIYDSRIVDNIAHADGSNAVVRGAAIEAGGGLTLVRTVVQGNRASATTDSGSATVQGGAIYVEADSVNVTSSKIVGNRATAKAADQADSEGAGLMAEGPVTLVGSTVQGNVATASGGTSAIARGGGLRFDSDGTLQGSQVAANQATAAAGSSSTAWGGGIDVSNTLSLVRSTVDSSQAHASAVLSSVADGGGVEAAGQVTMVGSTVSRNTASAHSAAQHQAGAGGGGLDLRGPLTDTMTNSTVALNAASASSLQGTANAVGGGIEARDASLFAAAVTVARNSVSSSGNVATSLGGGIRQDGSGVTLRATILAANTTPDSSDGPNCSGTVGTDGDNLLGALAGCTFTPFASDHPNVAAPGLGTLAPNGGPTQTISLQATSPAVDAIRAARCPAHKDQRGVKRPQGPRCDVGAFERST